MNRPMSSPLSSSMSASAETVASSSAGSTARRMPLAGRDGVHDPQRLGAAVGRDRVHARQPRGRRAPRATRSTYSEPKIVEGSTRAVTLAGIWSAWSGLSTIWALLLPASPLMVITRPTTRPWYLTLEAGPSESPEVGR